MSPLWPSKPRNSPAALEAQRSNRRWRFVPTCKPVLPQVLTQFVCCQHEMWVRYLVFLVLATDFLSCGNPVLTKEPNSEGTLDEDLIEPDEPLDICPMPDGSEGIPWCCWQLISLGPIVTVTSFNQRGHSDLLSCLATSWAWFALAATTQSRFIGGNWNVLRQLCLHFHARTVSPCSLDSLV